MKKFIVSSLIFLSLAALVLRFGYQPALDFLGYKTRGGIKITSVPDGATVLINGVEVGKTPYGDENMPVSEYQLKLVKDDAVWQGAVRLTKGTLAVVNRELAPSIASSSGEVLTLTPGRGVIITSTPDGARVEIGGKDLGKTPLRINDLEPGEYTFLISHSNYLKRSIRALLPPEMLLHLDTDLAISEVDLSNVATPTVSSTVTLTVKQTPTGFLRVRDKPSVTGKEVAKVVPGDSLVLLEELNGWDKVRMDNGTEGFVSASYVQKQP